MNGYKTTKTGKRIYTITPDLTGQKFGLLTVLDFLNYAKTKDGTAQWNCLCECGNKRISSTGILVNGHRKHCGASHHRGKQYTAFGKTQNLLTWAKEYGITYRNLARRINTQKMFIEEALTLIQKDLYKNGSDHPNWKGVGEIKGKLITHLQRCASKRKGEANQCTITLEELWELFLKQNRKCALSGVDIEFSNNSRYGETTASPDRIDSTKGYIPGNVQWVHKNINWMKQDFSDEEFIAMCKKVAAYR